MRPRVVGRRRRVALAAGLLASFVGCSGGGPTVDPTIKVEEGKKAEESLEKTRMSPSVKKQEVAPAQRKNRGPE